MAWYGEMDVLFIEFATFSQAVFCHIYQQNDCPVGLLILV